VDQGLGSLNSGKSFTRQKHTLNKICTRTWRSTSNCVRSRLLRKRSRLPIRPNNFEKASAQQTQTGAQRIVPLRSVLSLELDADFIFSAKRIGQAPNRNRKMKPVSVMMFGAPCRPALVSLSRVVSAQTRPGIPFAEN
jgi:hypothetical protein